MQSIICHVANVLVIFVTKCKSLFKNHGALHYVPQHLKQANTVIAIRLVSLFNFLSIYMFSVSVHKCLYLTIYVEYASTPLTPLPKSGAPGGGLTHTSPHVYLLANLYCGVCLSYYFHN